MRFVILSIVLLLPSLAIAQDKKWSVPSKDAQAKIESLLKELYKDDFAKAEKDVLARGRLAQTLLFEGKETKDSIPGRYVLFLKAHTLAAQAGDVNTALQAVDELAHDFAIPASTLFRMKIQMLKQASSAENAPADAYQSVIDRAFVILDDTLEADDFASSLQLIDAAKKAAKSLRSLVLYVSMHKKQEEIERQQKEFARWQPFADTLAKNPKDPEASLEMGKYYALVKGNWERGLPLLANGAKSSLRSLAQSDLANPGTDKQRRVVALGWYQIADDPNTDPAMKTQALLRAYHWYQENLANSNDEQRKLIEGKLQDISKHLPESYRIGEITSELKKIDVLSGPVYGCDFAPDAKRFIITGYDGNLRLFNTKSGKEIRQLDGRGTKAWTVAVADDGRHAVSAGFDNKIVLWDLTAGREIKVLEGHQDYVRSVAISHDGLWVLSGGDDRTVRLWNTKDGKEQRMPSVHGHTVWSVALSRDGRRALSGSLDKTICLWDTNTGELLKRLEGHADTVLSVAFTPDGRHAVSGSTDKTIRIWDLETSKTVQTFEGSEGYVHSVAVSPDGRRILSAGQDKMVRLWDTVTGKEIRKLEGHRDQIWHVAFSRDGRLAISSGQDATVRIWTGAR